MDPRIYTSSKTGDANLLRQLLRENPTLLFKSTPHGNTALHIAARFGHKNVVAEIYYWRRSLLLHRNLDGDTPLHLATRAGHYSAVSFFVDEILSRCGTEIEWELGQFEVEEVMRLRNYSNDTVLLEAVRHRRTPIVELLIKVDPGLGCLDNDAGESALYLAARDGMTEGVNLLVKSVRSFAHGGPDGQTALHAAVVGRHFDIMATLVRVKPQLIKETDRRGRTPLHYAAAAGDHRIALWLLKLDLATAYILDLDGHSPLHLAAGNGHTKVIAEIIELCPDSGELIDLRGRNFLHTAIVNGETSVVRCVLDTVDLEGILNQGDGDGNTPLHLAVMGRRNWIVKYLIWDGRVDQRARNKCGQTAVKADEPIMEQYMAFPKMWSIRKQINYSNKLIISPNQSTSPSSTTQDYRQMGNILLMVATLIATVTFAAAFTMPGGYNNNIGPEQGLALLRTSSPFRWFIVADTIAMTCSITAVCVIFWGSIFGGESYVYFYGSAMALTYIALQATGITFTTGVFATMPDSQYMLTLTHVVGSAFHISTCLILFQLAKMFSIHEAYRFLFYRLSKGKSKMIHRSKTSV